MRLASATVAHPPPPPGRTWRRRLPVHPRRDDELPRGGQPAPARPRVGRGPARRLRAGDRHPAQHRVRDGRPDRPGGTRRSPVSRPTADEPLGADPGVGPADRRRPRATSSSSPRFRVADPPNYTTFVTFRSQDGLDDRIEYTAGRPPVRLAQPPDDERASRRSRSRSPRRPRPRRTSRLGDTLAADRRPGRPDHAQPVPAPDRGGRGHGRRPVSRPRPDADPYWYDDPAPIRAAVGGTVDNPIAYVSGVIAPDAYADVFALDLPTAYRWRFYVDAADDRCRPARCARARPAPAQDRVRGGRRRPRRASRTCGPGLPRSWTAI